MTHSELIESLNYQLKSAQWDFETNNAGWIEGVQALIAVAQLHKPNKDYPEYCDVCWWEEHERENYPCQTIQAIEKELE